MGSGICIETLANPLRQVIEFPEVVVQHQVRILLGGDEEGGPIDLDRAVPTRGDACEFVPSTHGTRASPARAPVFDIMRLG